MPETSSPQQQQNNSLLASAGISRPAPLVVRFLRRPSVMLLVSFVLLLAGSWRRWTSLIADSGREMDLPLRLLRGEMLYQDVHHIYPPFSPYFNALLFRLFGVHLDVLLISGICFSLLLVFLCWRMARRVLPESEARLATMAVIVWCIFKPTGNLISPYSFAALHSTTMALGVVLLSLRYVAQPRRRELLLAGLLIGLAAITKQEFALAAAVTVTVSLWLVHRGRYSTILVRLALTATASALVALPVYGWLYRRVGWQTLVADCHLLYTHLPASLIFYNRQRTGMDQPLASLAQMLGGFSVGVAITGLIILLAALSLYRTRRTETTRSFSTDLRFLLFRCGLVILLAAAVVFTINLFAQGRWDGSPLRALPIVLAALIVYAWQRERRSDLLPITSADQALLILAVYSLAVLARVALRVPSGGAFGGFFLPTSLILLTYLTTRALPRAVEDWTRNQKLAARTRLAGRMLLTLALISTAVVFVVRYRRNFTVPVQTSRATLYAHKTAGPAIREALDFIQQHTAPDETIAVVPEGSDLAFLTERRMPLRHQIMIPGFMDEAEEQRAIARLQQENTRYIFVINRPMREFGQEAFGRDFYQTLGTWITGHYRLVKVCGVAADSTPGQYEIGAAQFFIRIHERTEKQPPAQ